MKASTQDPDLCVIGASEAGRAAAMGAIALGLTVTMVDDGDPGGMDNPDLLIEVLRRATEGAGPPSGTAINPTEVWARVERALARAAPERSHARLSAMNIRLLRGTAQFAGATSVTAAGVTIRARRIFIASSAPQPSQPADEWCETPQRVTIESLCWISRLPGHPLIVGGGHEAVAVAQALTRLGSQVNIIANPLLPGFDPELTAPLRRQLARSGVRLIEGPVSRIRPWSHASTDDERPLPSPAWRREAVEDDGIVIEMADGTVVNGSDLLRLDGKVPNIAAHAPDRAGIRHRNGAPILNAALRTTNARVYAIGPAAGATSAAMERTQAGVALRAAFLRQPARFRPETVAIVTATQPRIAMIGFSEQEAAARGPITMWRWPFAQTGPGLASDPPGAGYLKVVADRRGRLLGVGMVGDGVAESVPFWSLAMARGLSLADLADVALPSPAWAEASRAIALSHAAGRLGNPWVRRALRVLRWLG